MPPGYEANIHHAACLAVAARVRREAAADLPGTRIAVVVPLVGQERRALAHLLRNALREGFGDGVDAGNGMAAFLMERVNARSGCCLVFRYGWKDWARRAWLWANGRRPARGSLLVLPSGAYCNTADFARMAYHELMHAVDEGPLDHRRWRGRFPTAKEKSAAEAGVRRAAETRADLFALLATLRDYRDNPFIVAAEVEERVASRALEEAVWRRYDPGIATPYRFGEVAHLVQGLLDALPDAATLADIVALVDETVPFPDFARRGGSRGPTGLSRGIGRRTP
jgi:hypothetical protein